MTSLQNKITFIGVADLEVAAEFYGGKLGLRLRNEAPFALVSDDGGSMLRITRVDALTAAPYTVFGWAVTDIRASVSDLTSNGAEFQRYDFVEQDDLGIWTAPGGDRVAWLLDPFGNNLSLTQFVS